MDDGFRGKAQRGEQQRQKRHHHHAAADAEQPGAEAGKGAEGQQRRDQHRQGSKLHRSAPRSQRISLPVMKRHSAGVTGVIESRLPRRSTTMSASSSCSRSAASGISALLRS
ncbi:hypothetical protein D9M72_613440 [compost metagenome]